MDHKSVLKKIAKDFRLQYKGSFKYLKCTHREVALRNFLAGCPAPGYPRYGSLKDDREKYIEKFLSSSVFKKEQSGNAGTVVSRRALDRESERVKNISNSSLRKELAGLYTRIRKSMGKARYLTIAASGSLLSFDELVLHEFVHELINENKVVVKPWLWNEGLTTFLTYYGLGKENIFDKKNPNIKTSKGYIAYAKKWRRLFKGVSSPAPRLKLIKAKVLES